MTKCNGGRGKSYLSMKICLNHRRARFHCRGRQVIRRLIFERLEDRSLLTLVIEPGSLVLLPDTPEQAIPIHVVSTSPTTDPRVTGFNLRAQLANGHQSGAGPRFQAIDFGGGIWDRSEDVV